VVVDNARKMISKTIDISVTSVLQTTAGKMIFGRFDDRTHAVHDRSQQTSNDHRIAEHKLVDKPPASVPVSGGGSGA
jgi:hypothetical protein